MASWISRSLLGTYVGIVMISCCMSGVTCDVPDEVVYTDLHKSVRIGDSVVLTCRFRGEPLAVYWKKGDDPRKVPNLVSWIPTDDVTGLCEGERPCSIMEMNEDRSLVIKEVSIAEQGRYICRVSSYKGILIHNFTDVNVFAPPSEPYPIIEGCNDSVTLGNNYGCVISTHVGVNITCSASDFFPDLYLFFLHGSEKIAPLEIKKWTNDDGTRSKSVTVNALAHEIPYVCVVSDVPGNLEERAGTVFVSLIQQDDTLIRSTPKPHKPMGSVVIVVPILFVTIAGVCILIVCWRRHRRQDRTSKNEGRGQEEDLPLLDQMTIRGKLSFYELWMMGFRVTVTDIGKLNDTLHELGINKLVDGSKPLEVYQHLCQWKTNDVHDDQAESLKKALYKSRYGGAWKEIWGLRRSSAILVLERTLKHILWHIGEPGKINKFLSELIPGRATTPFEDTDEMSKLVQEPLRELKEWSKETFDKNPVVLLSLALERAGCNPVDRTFFCVPDEPISSDELHRFVQKLASRHCGRLANVVDLTHDEIARIIDEDSNDSFDAEAMISDWLAKGNNSQENSSHIDKRCKLNHAAISIGRHDLKGYLVGYGNHLIMADTGQQEHTEHTEETTSNGDQENDNHGNNVSGAELRRIVRYLGQTQLSEMFGEGDSYNAIKAWMEKESAAGQLISCRQSLRGKLSPIGMEDLIPLEIKEDVCLVELVDIAFRLMMTDIYPLAEALDISAHKLKSYKRQFLNKTKLSRGTIGVIIRLVEQTKNERKELCKVLARDTGLQEMVNLLKYGHELSYGDLCLVGYGDGSHKEQRAKISENLGIITGDRDTINILKYWRSLVQPPTYNPRTALADAVFPVLGKEKAISIVSGEIRHNGTLSTDVISFIRDAIPSVQALHVTRIIGVRHNSSQRSKLTINQVLEIWRESLRSEALEDYQREEICKRLDDGGFKTFSSKLHRGEYQHIENRGVIKEMVHAIMCDVASRLAEILGVKYPDGTSPIQQVIDEWEDKIRKKPLKEQERILLSNALLREGYSDFSSEIMTGFIAKPKKAYPIQMSAKPSALDMLPELHPYQATVL